MSGMADSIVNQLVPVFEREAHVFRDLNIEAVANELSDTLNGMVTSELIVTRELDPIKVADAFRTHRMLPHGQFSAAETSLYERSINEVARYLVEIASQLPRFKETEVKVQLQLLHGVQNTLNKLLEPLRKMAEAVWISAPQNTHPEFETAYRQAVARNVDQLELFGVDIQHAVRRYALSVAYIPLGLQEEIADDETLTQKGFEEILDTLPADSMKLLVRGQAGSGKSTLFRWTAMIAAFGTGHATHQKTSSLESLSKIGKNPWRVRVPFLIRLRSCKDGRLPPLEELTLDIASEVGKAPQEWVRTVLSDGRAILLIDGVDEVPRHLRRVVEGEVERFIKTYPQCCYLLSTRPTAVPPGWLMRLGFREAEVTPLSVLDREQLIEHWHRAVGLELEKVGAPVGGLSAIAEELKSTLRHNPALAKLATTPLLTAVICALHRERNQRLPETLDELCEALCQMLLHRRESESLDLSGFPEIYRTLSYSDKKSILRALAYDMVLNGRSELGRDKALQEATQVIELLGKKPENGAAILEGLVERSGMLREPAPDKIDFVHNTFKEYLAAEVFTERGYDGLLARNALDPDWRPVLVFSVLKGTESHNANLIRQILDENVDTPRNSAQRASTMRERQVVAVLLEASARLLRKEERDRVAKLREQLFPPATMAEAEMLASAGDSVVPFLRNRKKLTSRMAIASVRALRLIGTDAAREVLKEFLSEKRWTVIEELCLAVNPLEINAVCRAFIDGQLDSNRIRSQINQLSQSFIELLRANESSLQNLDFSRTQVQDITPLASLTSLRNLYLGGTQVQDITPLASLTALCSLFLNRTQIQDITPLTSLTSLKSLNFSGTQVQDLTPLTSLSSLKSLDLSNTQVQDITPLASLSSLQSLDLSNTQVQDLTPLASLSSLQTLHLGGIQQQDLTPLASLSSLQTLHLGGIHQQDLTQLEKLTSLKALYIVSIQWQDLAPLEKLASLQTLYIGGIPHQDLTPLARLTSLQTLYIGSFQQQDLTPLASLTSLKKLKLMGFKGQSIAPLISLIENGLVVEHDAF